MHAVKSELLCLPVFFQSNKATEMLWDNMRCTPYLFICASSRPTADWHCCTVYREILKFGMLSGGNLAKKSINNKVELQPVERGTERGRNTPCMSYKQMSSLRSAYAVLRYRYIVQRCGSIPLQTWAKIIITIDVLLSSIRPSVQSTKVSSQATLTVWAAAIASPTWWIRYRLSTCANQDLRSEHIKMKSKYYLGRNNQLDTQRLFGWELTIHTEIRGIIRQYDERTEVSWILKWGVLQRKICSVL